MINENNEFIIRKPSPRDVDVLTEYVNELSKEKTFVPFQGEKITKKEMGDFLKKIIKNIKEKKEIQLFLFKENNLIGIASVSLKQKIFNHLGVTGVSIKKDFRGKGLGKMLMKKALEEASSLVGIKKIILGVFANNKVAINLYKKLGFKEYGCLPCAIKWRGKFVDEVLMYKDIKK